MSAEAIRNPERGKAHRPVEARGVLSPGRTATACDPWLSANARGLTERVPVEQVAPEDQCRRCWPGVAR